MPKKSDIVRFRPARLNIGMAIFFIIIVYVAFNIFYYVTSESISAYQVSQGNIATNNTYQGLILREEEIYYAPYGGYINYFQKSGSKVAFNSMIYSIDTDGGISKEINQVNQDGTLLSDASLQEISREIDGFYSNRDLNHFGQIYTFRDDLDSEISQILSAQALDQLGSQITNAVANNTFYKVNAQNTGIIVYYTDGFEDITPDDFQPEMLNGVNYVKNSLSSNSQIEASSPVYKLITSEDWNIIIEVSDSTYESIQESSSLKIRFCKDDYTCNVGFTAFDMNQKHYLNLALKTAMIRYINDRFIDIEIIQSDSFGLKVPKSSIVYKDFYTIPKRFFTQGGDSSDKGILVKSNSDNANSSGVSLVLPTIYFESEDYYYIDDEYVKEGDIIQGSDTQKVYVIGTDIDTLVGVYNINKGYAVFKQINIIFENEEYAIVESKTKYGVSLYDHIALDGSKVKENQLVNKK